MKKSTKYFSLGLIVVFILIFFIGVNKKEPANTPASPVNESDQMSITIIGVDEVLLEKEEFDYSSMTVYELLTQVCKEHDLAIETKGFGEMVYIASIDGLAEFDYGSNSGWLYNVNGEYPQIGCGAYTIKEGDAIEWIYYYEKD